MQPRLESLGGRGGQREAREGFGLVSRGELGDMRVVEGQPAGRELEEQASECVEIGPRSVVAPFPAELLGRHIPRAAGDLRVQQVVAFELVERLRDPEVRQLEPRAGVARGAQEHVGRLEVLVHHAARVGVRERVEQL